MHRNRYVLIITCLMLGLVQSAEARVPPSCLLADGPAAPREVSLTFDREGVRLSGRLFLPPDPGPHPAVVFLHGGGREKLNDAPLFFAARMVRCGLAAFVYDKRGTGGSEGAWEQATFDDFVQDALVALHMLRQRPEIHDVQVGVVGFSQGGRLAPVVAAQDPQVAFVVSLSAPFGSIRATRLYALRLRLQQRGLTGTALHTAFSLWERHLDAVARQDRTALVTLDSHVQSAARDIRPSLLPPTSDRLPRSPVYNSLSRDYTPELSRLQVPLLALYGERDQTVPVELSVSILRETLDTYGHTAYDVRIIPYADHSFIDRTFQQRIPIEQHVIDWLLNRLSDLQAAEAVLTGTQSTCLQP